MMPDIRSILLGGLDEAFDRKAWHGPTMRGTLRGVSANQAFWRPAAERHNIWELAVHCAYWKYAVRRKLTGERRGSFPRRGSNWFPTPSPDEKTWRDDRRLLDDEHRALREAVENLPAAQLAARARIIRGAALHDVYHAGQIQLLKRMYGL